MRNFFYWIWLINSVLLLFHKSEMAWSLSPVWVLLLVLLQWSWAYTDSRGSLSATWSKNSEINTLKLHENLYSKHKKYKDHCKSLTVLQMPITKDKYCTKKDVVTNWSIEAFLPLADSHKGQWRSCSSLG